MLFRCLCCTLYIRNRTSTFISLSKNSGACVEDSSLNECCEVPRSVSGQFSADICGYWNTEANFFAVNSIYGVKALGLTYTNDEWTEVMTKADSKLFEVAVTKGEQRDLAWNMIAWASFSFVTRNSIGVHTFYTQGNVAIIFAEKTYYSYFASADNTDGSNPISNNVFSTATSRLTTTINLDCYDSTSFGYETYICKSACPSLVPLQGFGFDPTAYNSSPEFDSSFDMVSVSTAIAINYGIIPIDVLIPVAFDTKKKTLIKKMIASGYITKDEASRFNAYIDPVYVPMDPIYCIHYDNQTYTKHEVITCLVLIGEIFTLPYIVHAGWG